MLVAMNEIVELIDLDAFRRFKRGGRGVIVMKRGGSQTTIHHPDCGFVTEDGFSEKIENRGRAGYFWADSLDTACGQWPLAHVCGHPSDPLAGGAGGNEVSRSLGLAQDGPRSLPSIGATWEVA